MRENQFIIRAAVLGQQTLVEQNYTGLSLKVGRNVHC